MLQENNNQNNKKIKEIKDNVIKQMDIYSSETSKFIRITNLGLLGAIWTILTTMQDRVDFKHKILGIISLETLLLFFILIIVLSLFFDFLQYYFGYLNKKKVFHDIENGKHNVNRTYDDEDKYYIWMCRFFTLKIWTTIINIGFVLITIFVMVFWN